MSNNNGQQGPAPALLFGEAFLNAIRHTVREVIKEELKSFQASNGPSAHKREWLKAEELAELYGLPKTWFEERGRAGEIARTKPGRYVLFARRDVENFLERNKQST
jgi:excisionase family DNA binding protein